jgi:hypothetical protein
MEVRLASCGVIKGRESIIARVLVLDSVKRSRTKAS